MKINPINEMSRLEPMTPLECVEMIHSELYRLQECIIRLKRIHKPKYRHECLDWDGLEIDEFDPEFEICTCLGDNKP